jgi:hypothetical protein
VDKKEEIIKETQAEEILAQRKYFLDSSRGIRDKWTESWEMYNSKLDDSKNPYLANLFIPKIHEAVELLAAFLVGPNQSINIEAEGKGDAKKEPLVQKWLDFMWRKTIKMRPKLVTFVKQGLIFGNGIMKVGWDEVNKKPFVETISMPDVYFDYYTADIQESMVIHRIIKDTKDVQNDKKYNRRDREGFVRNRVISTSDMLQDEESTRFDAYDKTINTQNPKATTEILEAWTQDQVITIAPTSLGYKTIREAPNPFKYKNGDTFIPFVKLRLKNNPLPNRAYDMGAVEPTIKLQKAFNDMMNEVFDNVSLVNNKMWKKRRGSGVNPMDLVSRPGGIVEVNDINDLEGLEVSDIKASGIKMLEILDNEFQQASMVVNLLKGVPGAEFATEAAIGQQNVQTMMSMIDLNIKDALSELGQMVLEISLKHQKGMKSIRVLDDDQKTVFVEVELKNIDGLYDIKVIPDRSAITSKIVVQKQLLDFLKIVSADEMVAMRYPQLRIRVYRKWLEEAGFGDVDSYFEEQPQQGAMPFQNTGGRPGNNMTNPQPFQSRTPTINQGLTDQANIRMASPQSINA